MRDDVELICQAGQHLLRDHAPLPSLRQQAHLVCPRGFRQPGARRRADAHAQSPEPPRRQARREAPRRRHRRPDRRHRTDPDSAQSHGQRVSKFQHAADRLDHRRALRPTAPHRDIQGHRRANVSSASNPSPTSHRSSRCPSSIRARAFARDVLSRIFEPYFTTKEQTGTGLGLAIVSRLVKHHHGLTQVKTKLGRRHALHHLSSRQGTQQFRRSVSTEPDLKHECAIMRDALVQGRDGST